MPIAVDSMAKLGRGATAALLQGNRLHLQQGPINLVIKAYGPEQSIKTAYEQACTAFHGLLEGLVAELDRLRQPVTPKTEAFNSSTAQRMLAATLPFYPEFITPMAAVAGAVADEILAAMKSVPDLKKIFVNNGGDIALWLASGEEIAIGVVPSLARAVPEAKIKLRAEDGIGGIATSGWDGHSYSLGIADAVTVLADYAATADAAATMIANAVNVEHPAIERQPACELDPDCDLGTRLVTVAVPVLAPSSVEAALKNGISYARRYMAKNIVKASLLALQDHQRSVALHD